MTSFYPMIQDSLQKFRGLCVAIMGGGGKTHLLVQLGRELAYTYSKVTLTSLTQCLPLPGIHAVQIDSIPDGDLPTLFNAGEPLQVTGARKEDGKYSGISELELEHLMSQSDLCLVETDGARNLPLKVHNDLDPRVPALATHVIIVIGADVINTKLSDGFVHRPELFKEAWGIADDAGLDVDFIARVVTSRRGYLSRIPYHQKPAYFVNKADTHAAAAESLARAIAAMSKMPAYWGSLKEQQCYAVHKPPRLSTGGGLEGT